MRVHCPRCGKHYLVAESRGLPLETSHFICTACEYEFSLPSSKAPVVAPTHILPELTHCPFCAELIVSGQDECPHCLKIPSKFEGASKTKDADSPDDPLTKKVNEAWQDLLDGFAESEHHQRFISLCQQLGRMDFAQERYERLQQIIGEDAEIEKRLQQIKFIEWQSAKKSEELAVEEQPLKKWQIRTILSIVAITLILIGTLAHHVRIVATLGLLILGWLFLDSIKK